MSMAGLFTHLLEVRNYCPP